VASPVVSSVAPAAPAVLDLPGYLAGTWDIDPEHSYVGFTVRHLIVTKVHGRFGAVRGEITAAKDPLKSAATVAIDLASIDTGNATRDEHLRSTDFLDTAQFPEMTYRTTGVRPDGERFVIDGELTLKGVTRSVPLSASFDGVTSDPWGGTRAGFSALASINRRDFGVTFDGKADGVAIVAERVDIHIDVEAVLRLP
jgi:polyisoprenoid-binding protein YceI